MLILVTNRTERRLHQQVDPCSVVKVPYLSAHADHKICMSGIILDCELNTFDEVTETCSICQVVVLSTDFVLKNFPLTFQQSSY
jgi:hypothetical protein